MGIQKCDDCNSSFKWSSIIKSLWLGYKPIQCSQCSKKYSIDFKTRYRLTLSMIAPLFIFAIVLSNTNALDTFSILLSIILFGLLITSIIPFIVKYRPAKLDKN